MLRSIGAEQINGALQRADGRGRDRTGKHLGKGNGVDRVAVDQAPWCGLEGAIVGALHPVRRDKGVFDEDVVAAGAAQAEHFPVALNLVVHAWQEEGAMFGRQVPLRREDTAEQHPLTVFATAGKAPAPADAIAAFDHCDLGGRHIG
ncbi:hypothetical protein D3C79_714330 [compost metagenome]